MSAEETRMWVTLRCRDTETMAAYFSAMGFTEHSTYRDEADSAVIVHAEWLWPGGGGIMFGTARGPDDVLEGTGPTAAYLVTDDPDTVFDKAVAAGASVIRPMQDEDYGGRGGVVRDPEGNHWSFGSYQPR